MPPSLHTDLWLTRRIVTSTCRFCVRRCEVQKRKQQTRSFASSQRLRKDADSLPTPPVSSDEQKTPEQNTAGSSIASEKHDAIQNLPNHSHSGPPPTSPNLSQQHNVYGSYHARRARANANKESQWHFTIPDWFTENNITLAGQGSLSPQATSRIKYVHPKRALSLLDPTNGADDTQPDEGYSESEIKALQQVMQWFQFSSKDDSPDLRRSRRTSQPARYALHMHYLHETVLTAMGLMIPPQRPEHVTEPAVKTAHLMLHYAARDGELLLDEFVQDIASRVNCDLVSLDVQDLSELIAFSDQSTDFVSEARHLSYKVLQNTVPDNTAPELDDLADAEEDGEDESPSFDLPPFGRPMMTSKPVMLDLSDWIGSVRDRIMPPRSPRSLMSSKNSDKDFFSTSDSRFGDLADRLLTTIAEKRHQSSSIRTSGDEAASTSTVSGPRTMIHIKDVKRIQDHHIGARFLGELFKQIDKRRADGERIMVVGTECAKQDDDKTMSKDQISRLQKLKDWEISRTIVLTPVPDDDAEANFHLREDRRIRNVRINLRHLRQMTELKSIPKSVLDLGSDFWKEESWLGQFHSKWRGFAWIHKILTFSEIHRVAIMLAGISQSCRAIVETEQYGREYVPWPLFFAYGVGLHSDRVKYGWARSQQKREATSNAKEPVETAQIMRIRQNATKHEKKLLSGVIEPSKIQTTFDDVHVPFETVDALQTLTSLSLVRPEAFRYGVLASDRIPGLLLYGPPGTGKTLLAKAVAKESGARVLEVSAADINDMYVGEGEKNVKALFSLAKKLSPCIVFLDEADAMFSARSASGRRVAHRELLNQFLKEWDGMNNDAGSAFIMVATNRPMDLDDAVLRRLPRRLLVDLPTERDRQHILKIHLKHEQLSGDVDLEDLAKKTPFYSGSDLKNLAVAAALNAVKEENEAAEKHNFNLAQDKPEYKPEECAEETMLEENAQEAVSREHVEANEPEQSVDKSPSATPYQYPDRRTLKAYHFEKALEEITASISEDMSSLKEIKKFDDQFGDKKGKKRKKPTWGFRSAKEAEKVLDTVKVRDVA